MEVISLKTQPIRGTCEDNSSDYKRHTINMSGIGTSSGQNKTLQVKTLT